MSAGSGYSKGGGNSSSRKVEVEVTRKSPETSQVYPGVATPPIPTLPDCALIASEPALTKIISLVEVAVRVLPEEIVVELADWMVKVEAEPVVFQREAAAPVRFRELVAEMVSVLMVIVLPIVAVAVYIFAHLKF